MLIRKLLCRGLFCLVVSSQLACAAQIPSQDRPDHTTALSQINNLISDEQYFTITNLVYVKENSFQQDANNYIVSTTFTRTFKVSSATLKKSYSDLPSPSDSSMPSLVMKSQVTLLGMLGPIYVDLHYGHFEPGDYFDEAQQFRFLRTESGWILQNDDDSSATVVVNRHTENADALDAKAKQDRAAQIQKIDAVQRAANAAADIEMKRRNAEVKNACATGRPMRITKSMMGFAGYMQEGLVVVGVPDANTPVGMCHVKWSIPGTVWERGAFRPGTRIISGYVPMDRLLPVNYGSSSDRPLTDQAQGRVDKPSSMEQLRGPDPLFTDAQRRRQPAVKKLCASWHQMIIWRTRNEYIAGNGQVVQVVPDDNAPMDMCHVQISVGGRITSGYVPYYNFRCLGSSSIDRGMDPTRPGVCLTK